MNQFDMTQCAFALDMSNRLIIFSALEGRRQNYDRDFWKSVSKTENRISL